MRVNTEELAGQASELRLLAIRTVDIQENIRYVKEALSRESIGERFRPALNLVVSELELSGEDIGRLSRALDQICSAYEMVERRVVEETEYTTMHQQRMEPQVIRLPNLGMLAQTEVIPETGMAGTGGTGLLDWTPWDPETAI